MYRINIFIYFLKQFKNAKIINLKRKNKKNLKILQNKKQALNLKI
jgi:hypothetical protein